MPIDDKTETDDRFAAWKAASDAATEMANAIIGTSILKRMSVATQEWVRLNVANKQPARQSKGPGF